MVLKRGKTEVFGSQEGPSSGYLFLAFSTRVSLAPLFSVPLSSGSYVLPDFLKSRQCNASGAFQMADSECLQCLSRGNTGNSSSFNV